MDSKPIRENSDSTFPDSPGEGSEPETATAQTGSTLFLEPGTGTMRTPQEAAIRWGRMTRVLQSWQAGSPRALEKLQPMVSDELRILAGDSAGRDPGRPLQPASLVNDILGRLGGNQRPRQPERAPLVATVMECMRALLVELSRETKGKPGRLVILPIEVVDQAGKARPVRVDSALLSRLLVALRELDPRLSLVVELRVFAGISSEETAALLGISRLAARRDWTYARAWLREELAGSDLGKGWSLPIK